MTHYMPVRNFLSDEKMKGVSEFACAYVSLFKEIGLLAALADVFMVTTEFMCDDLFTSLPSASRKYMKVAAASSVVSKMPEGKSKKALDCWAGRMQEAEKRFKEIVGDCVSCAEETWREKN